MLTASFQDGAWFTSSYTNGGANDCVEVNYSLPGHVGVRDSKLGTTSPVLAVPSTQWASLITADKDNALAA
ncbi:MAG: DUF397 domain-containing protein [Pseudonocardiaceae bacterium]